MNLPKISYFLHNVLDLINELHHTVTHKIFTWVIGIFAGYTTIDHAGTVSPAVFNQDVQLSWASWFFKYFQTMNPVEWLSFLCLLALFFDRCLIIWAWFKRIKRGDYNLPNVGKKK